MAFTTPASSDNEEIEVYSTPIYPEGRHPVTRASDPSTMPDISQEVGVTAEGSGTEGTKAAQDVMESVPPSSVLTDDIQGRKSHVPRPSAESLKSEGLLTVLLTLEKAVTTVDSGFSHSKKMTHKSSSKLICHNNKLMK